MAAMLSCGSILRHLPQQHWRATVASIVVLPSYQRRWRSSRRIKGRARLSKPGGEKQSPKGKLAGRSGDSGAGSNSSGSNSNSVTGGEDGGPPSIRWKQTLSTLQDIVSLQRTLPEPSAVLRDIRALRACEQVEGRGRRSQGSVIAGALFGWVLQDV